MRSFITGGVRSGKSAYALELARAEFARPSFLATAEGFDDDMRERVRRHREERGPGFPTVEEPLRIDLAVAEDMLVDCLTVWVNNLLHHGREAEFEGILTAFLGRLPANVVIVSNETGLGTIPMDPLTRRYNELLAQANRRTAAACDRVFFMVAGLPLRIK